MNARHLNRGVLLALVRRRASRLAAGGLALAVSVLSASSAADAVAAHNASHVRSPKWVARSTHLTQSGARSVVQRTLGRSWGGDGDTGSRGGGPAGSTGNQLGHSVAISGNFAVVSAPGTNNDTGLANFWQHEGGGWQQVLTLPDPRRAEDDYFAWAVAVSSTKSGTYAAIGGNDSNGKPDRVYIYTKSGGSWDLQATIDDPGTSYKDMYGDNLAISPSTLVVGASCGEANSGAAYIYHHDGSRWVLQDSILDPRATADDFFGQAVAVSGNRVMIGAVGWAYVYTYTSGQGWTRTATIANPGPSGDSFGQSVALSGTGTTAVITAPGVPPAGAAYVYDLSGTTWARQQELTEPGGGEFGWAAAMSGSELLVGMPIGGQPNCGTAFAYKLSGAKFTLQEPVADPDASCATGDQFGYSVALSSTYGTFGAPGANNGQGASYELPLP